VIIPLPYTLLPLFRYAQIMGVPPLPFAQGVTPGIDPMIFPDGECSSVWFQHDWQNFDQVSREQLAEAIRDAEYDIAGVVGYFPAPQWVAQDERMWTRPYLREAFSDGYDVRGLYKEIDVRYGKIIQTGRRAVTYVGTASTADAPPTLAYTDDDADGYYETASLILPTAFTDVCELKLYVPGFGGALEYEIRPVRSKSISGGNVTFVLWSWQLIDPNLYEAFPTEIGVEAVDVSTTTNFLTDVEVYREYVDTTQPAVQFLWDHLVPCPSCGGSGCEICTPGSQYGCATIRNGEGGVIVPLPATFQETPERDDVGAWVFAEPPVCREPDRLKAWYYSGDISPEYAQGRSCDPLSYEWAKIIALIATARLERPFCGCGNIEALAQDLRTDLTLVSRESSYFLTQEVQNCPFGTRKGEVMAWRRIAKATPRKIKAVLV